MAVIPLPALFNPTPPATAVTVQVAGRAPSVDHKATLTGLFPTGVQLSPWQLPITDPSVDYSNLEDDWVEVDRPGRVPLLVRKGGKLRKLKLNVTFQAPDGDPTASVEDLISVFVRMASARDTAGNLTTTPPLALTYAPMDSAQWLTMTGHWRITSMTITSKIRVPGSNAVSQATMAIELTEASDPPPTPLAQQIQPGFAPPAIAPTAVAGPSLPSRVVIVQVGDTLYTLAARVYGASEPGWRVLANANGITDPRDLTPGQALAVP